MNKKLKEIVFVKPVYLVIITITGLFYNVGMIAGPWFEGQLAQCLADIYDKNKTFSDMVLLVVFYLLTIAFVQGMRIYKRLYVRKFANEMNRSLKLKIYDYLLHQNRKELGSNSSGSYMTKVLSDVEACVEGIRKFTTEIFDTGVVMVAYLAMLIYYDFKLAIISLLFPPIAYIIAEKLKKRVSKAASNVKKSSENLNNRLLERVGNVSIYRNMGLEERQNELLEKDLSDFEKKSIASNLLENSLQPIYLGISSISVLFIFYFGGRYIGQGVWNIAAFTTFLSCFTKLATKSSKAAKLFNSVQKASVSFKRIESYLDLNQTDKKAVSDVSVLSVENIGLSIDDKEIFHDISFKAEKGQMIGITGGIASGKSLLGQCFLNEWNFQGNVLTDKVNLKEQGSVVGYMGHDLQLFNDSIQTNVAFDSSVDVSKYLQMVNLDEEVAAFEEKEKTMIADKGARLSGGQQARLALARTCYFKKPIIVLDDPFAAVDIATEMKIFKEIKEYYRDSIVLLISHRLECFEQCDGVLYLHDHTASFDSHQNLMEQFEDYKKMVLIQKGEEHE